MIGCNMSVALLVKKVLASVSQPLTASRIASELAKQGFPNINKNEVNSYLYMAQSNGTVRKVEISGFTAPGWQLTDSTLQQMGLLPKPVEKSKPQESLHPALSLYRWQTEALGVWEKNRYQGMIEAVTGSGKTRLAFAAWEQLRQKAKPLNTLVVVPTIPLMNQWHDSFQALFPNRKIGRIGDNHRDDFSKATICVAVINSAVNHVGRLLSHCRIGPTKSFLIADECHRYIDAPVFSEIRRFPFNHVMALSATIDQFVVRGYGQIIYSYSFGDAVRDGLVPRFDMINVAVPLTAGERVNYDELTKKIGDQIEHVKLIFEHELRSASDEWFWRKLKQLLVLPDGTDEPSIKRLFGLMFRRTKIVYTAQHKMRLAKEISQCLLNQGSKKMIAFFERIQTAEDVQEDLAVETAEQLRQVLVATSPIWCRVLHSGLDQKERKSVLDEFRVNGVSALLTCRVLDEGLDVPQIDAALLVASTQSRRQRIQRIGRALRKGDRNKRPMVITLSVPGTTDGNVTADDGEIFGDAAKIYHVAEHDCISTLKSLLV
jgi:superfamily II DNA or RNA helicase